MNFAHSLGYLKNHSTLSDIEHNLYFGALSVYYVHTFGHTIDLYATKEYKFLKDLLGYDNYYEIENDDTIPAHVYSKYKMIALKNMPLDTIHIDTDVIITKNTAFELIRNSTADMTVQYIYTIESKKNKEEINMDNELFKSILYLMSLGILTTFPKDLTSINGGIYKFTNQELKNLIIDNYFSFYHNNSIINKIPCEYIILDNYGEEFLNYHTAIDNGYIVKSIEPIRSIEDDGKLYYCYEEAIGLHHYFGTKSHHIEDIKWRLFDVDRNLYTRVNKWLKETANKIFLE